MRWKTTCFWANETVFIIGGGSSLKGFDWTPLHAKHVIGCNDTYQLGDWVDICCFGDAKWCRRHRDELAKFKGLKVTWRDEFEDEPDVMVLKGRPGELSLESDRIGWNTNTGALAINLAVKFGCTKIILLGFDMKLSNDGSSNWYKNLLDRPNKVIFKKFYKGFECLKAEMKTKVPDVVVLNANPDSDLDLFPKITLEEALVQ